MREIKISSISSFFHPPNQIDPKGNLLERKFIYGIPSKLDRALFPTLSH